MTLLRTLVLGAAALLLGSVAADDKKPEFDAAKLLGKWTVTSGIKDGADAGADAVKDTTMTVEKEKITLKGPKGEFVFKYTIDAKTSPVSIDLEIVAPEDFKGSKSKGIISLDGDAVKLSYHPMAGDRPKDFDAKKGTGEYFFMSKKAK